MTAHTPPSLPPVPTVAVVVVHGMGEQREGETLLEWAEPLLGRIDWAIAHDPSAPPGRAPGVRITSSSLGVGADARVDATVQVDGTQDLAVTFLEATWSRSFVPVTRVETFRWGSRFLWRALFRLYRQVSRTILWLPFLSLRGHKSWLTHLRESVGAFFGALFAGLIFILMVVLGAVGTVLLTLISPILLVPGIKLVLQPLLDTLVAYVGDVATYKRHPLRAAAMEGVVIKKIIEAHDLVRDAPGSQVIVIAHSQGSAITVTALLDGGLATETWNTTLRLNTVGAAVSLISSSSFVDRASDRDFAPVHQWAKAHPEIDWENFWAIWDPVPSGPMGDTTADRDARWRESYTRHFARTIGPGEHPVHNTSSPLTDHQTYARNILQVIDPLVDQISPSAAVLLREEISPTALRQTVALRRSRPVVWLLSALTSLSLVGWRVPGWLENLPEWFGFVETLLAALAPIVVASLVYLALVWVHGSWSAALERAVVWPHSRTGISTAAVVAPLAVYSILAIASVTNLLVRVWGGWGWASLIVIVPVAFLLVLSVFAAPPRALPERREASDQAPT